jgi:hypothetical protein
MWTKAIALVAALGAVPVHLAHAQSVDPNPADRGYPAYAQPHFSGYYMGVPQGDAARAPAAASGNGGHRSEPSALHDPAAIRRRGSVSRGGGVQNRQAR